MTADMGNRAETQWRIELLGGARLLRAGQERPNFKTRRMTLLLARLACFPNRAHPRDVLAEELWPDDDPYVIRERFRQTLTLLRRELEPPELASGSVLVADRSTVRLAPAAFSTDVADFEAALRLAAGETVLSHQIPFLQQAVALYGGELLPGFYEDWIQNERGRLEEHYRRALNRLTAALAETGQFGEAAVTARQAAAADPLSEEAHCVLIRLLAQTGRIADAQRQYEEWERVLREEIGGEPTFAAKTLIAQVRAGAFAPAPTLPAPSLVSSPAPTPAPALSSAAPAPSPSARPAPLSAALPVPLTRFFGREEEIERLTTLLSPDAFPLFAPAPLVTLTGSGGAGKTRLALETARRVSAAYEGAAWFVPLADVAHAELIGDAIIETLGIARSAQAAPLEQAIDHLQTCPASLLILDNFEHLQEEGVGQIQHLRARLPRLSCLVTSRHKLNLEGERDMALPPLTTPDAPKTPEQLLGYPSIQLFLDRAQAARYSFALTTDNAHAVSVLGQRLEGIPLAIELAAAWAATLTPEQILARLSRRFDLLVSRRKDVPQRHQSLQAVLEGSYQQLPPKLQHLYAHLSVFRGGWTLEAAEQVAGAQVYGEASSLHVLDGLALLQERSFVQAEERGAEMRYRLLESLREFGAEQLEAAERAALAQRHAHYFLALAQEAQERLRTPEEKRWFDRLEAEYDNLRAVLEWGGENDLQSAFRLAARLENFWLSRGFVAEAREWLRRALARPGEMSLPRAESLICLARMNLVQGEYSTATQQARESLAALRALEDQNGIAKAVNTLGAILMEQGIYGEAQECYEECLSLCRAAGNHKGVSIALANLGNLAYGRGDYERACAYYSECLTTRRDLGDQRGIATVLDWLARTLREQGDYARACEMHEESLVMRRELNDRQNIAACLSRLGTVKMYLGEYHAARAFLAESLVQGRETGDRVEMANTIAEMGELSRREQDKETARACWRESLEILVDAGDKSGIAGILEAVAGLAVSEAQCRDAAQMLGLADAIREEISNPVRPSMRPHYEQTLATVQNTLGETRFRQAWEAGRALSLEEAIKLTK